MNKATSGHSMPKRYDDILFDFISHAEECSGVLLGSVLFRENEMVLDIQDEKALAPYLIIGKYENNYYQGRNSDQKMGRSVEAAWAKIDKTYVGTWVEDGIDYLFSFKISELISSK